MDSEADETALCAFQSVVELDNDVPTDQIFM